jgi:two-component system sensor histidine kinase GlrK
VPLPADASDLVLREFGDLNTASGALAAASQRAIEEEVVILQTAGQEARRRLAWQAAALVPAMLVIMGLFYLLVIRPLRRLDRAIDLLGKGSLGQPIQVSGPSDLSALGGQLEWLRLRLIEIAEEKNRFLRHMSHELKTPLANMREGSELLMDGAVGDLSSEQKDVTRILRDNSLKLQQLIENLLSFSAWQAKNAELDFQPLRIAPLVQSVLRQHRLTLAGRDIEVATFLEDIELIGDKDKIRLVLDNLISNAMKFTPRGGRITIEARCGTREMILEVGDTGPGVPRSERDMIFDAFYRGSARQRGRLEGTGIGLSVVAECVQAHRGRIEIHDAEGGGALFRVILPLEQLAASA